MRYVNMKDCMGAWVLILCDCDDKERKVEKKS